MGADANTETAKRFSQTHDHGCIITHDDMKMPGDKSSGFCERSARPGRGCPAVSTQLGLRSLIAQSGLHIHEVKHAALPHCHQTGTHGNSTRSRPRPPANVRRRCSHSCTRLSTSMKSACQGYRAARIRRRHECRHAASLIGHSLKIFGLRASR